MICDGPKIRELRLQKALTIEKLAEEAGVTYKTVQRAETESRCSQDTLARLAFALEVEPVELLPKKEEISATDLEIIREIFEQLKLSKALPAYDPKTALHIAANITEHWTVNGIFGGVNQDTQNILKKRSLVRTPLIGQIGDFRVGIFVRGFPEIDHIDMAFVDTASNRGVCINVYGLSKEYLQYMYEARYSAYQITYVDLNDESKGFCRIIYPYGFIISRIRLHISNHDSNSNINVIHKAYMEAMLQCEPNFEPVPDAFFGSSGILAKKPLVVEYSGKKIDICGPDIAWKEDGFSFLTLISGKWPVLFGRNQAHLFFYWTNLDGDEVRDSKKETSSERRLIGESKFNEPVVAMRRPTLSLSLFGFGIKGNHYGKLTTVQLKELVDVGSIKAF